MKSYTVIQKPAMTIVGIECRTSNNFDAGPRDIPQHWERFYSENIIEQIPNKISNEVVALYCNYEGDYTQPYSLIIGCQSKSADKIPDGMAVKVLPVSFYAVFDAIGEHPQSLIGTWGKIWQTSLDRTYTGDYEVYGNKFFSESPKEVNVYIAIK